MNYNSVNYSAISADLTTVFFAVLVFAVFYLFLRFTKKPLKEVLQRTHLDSSKISLIVDKLFAFFIIALGLITAAAQLGVNITATLAGMGVLGVAVSFAAKDALGNIIAGFMIYWDRPFKLGEWIEIQGSYGKVTKITLRTTRIKTLDNRRVIVPNARIVDEVLINHSKGENVRIDNSVGIGYEESIEKAREVILNTVNKIEGVLEEPKSEVVVEELGDSAVVLTVRTWVKDEAKERRISFEIKEKVKMALDEAGIEMPYPHSVIIQKERKNLQGLGRET